MKFNKQLRTIFLDPNSKPFKIDERVNVILSPALYWVKKVKLPVKYVRDAMKLLPSIFEDTIPDGNYSYSAYKDGDEFIIFAYEDKLILDTMMLKGIQNSNIAKVYFAQSELGDIQKALKIDESQSLYKKDDIIILVPCCWLEEAGELDLSDIKHSKHNISLAQFGHIVDNKSLYKIGAILSMFILLAVVELFITTDKIQQIEMDRDGLFEKYHLKATMFQNRAMLKRYKGIYNQQSRLREYISNILALKLKKGHKIEAIALKAKRLTVTFSGIDSKNKSYIIDRLNTKHIDFKHKFKGKTFELEMSI